MLLHELGVMPACAQLAEPNGSGQLRDPDRPLAAIRNTAAGLAQWPGRFVSSEAMTANPETVSAGMCPLCTGVVN